MRNVKVLDLVIPRKGNQRHYAGMFETFLNSGADYAVLYDYPGEKSKMLVQHIQNYLFRHKEYPVEPVMFHGTLLLRRIVKD